MKRIIIGAAAAAITLGIAAPAEAAVFPWGSPKVLDEAGWTGSGGPCALNQGKSLGMYMTDKAFYFTYPGATADPAWTKPEMGAGRPVVVDCAERKVFENIATWDMAVLKGDEITVYPGSRVAPPATPAATCPSTHNIMHTPERKLADGTILEPYANCILPGWGKDSVGRFVNERGEVAPTSWTYMDGYKLPIQIPYRPPYTAPAPAPAPSVALAVESTEQTQIGTGNTALSNSGNTTTTNINSGNTTNNITTINNTTTINKTIVITIGGQTYKVTPEGRLVKVKKRRS